MTGIMQRVLLVAAAILLLSSQPAQAQIQTARVTGGDVKGVLKDGVASYKGLPFAAAPVGELRWKAPQPVTPWTGVKKADAFGPGCMQGTTTAAKTIGCNPTLIELSQAQAASDEEKMSAGGRCKPNSPFTASQAPMGAKAKASPRKRCV